MTMSTFLAFLGLFMAVLELYFPNMSVGLERLIGRFQEKLVVMAMNLKNAPDAVHSWVMGSRVGRFYSKHWKVILVLGILPFGISLLFNAGEDLENLLLVLGLLPILLMIAYDRLLGYFYILTWVLRAPIFVFDKVFRFLNFIGRGKALSGIGLLMAFWGLAQPLLIP
ncbi:hypothetical protein [Paraglaciecola sp. MB-3u-78]|jgi:hypothetical protein|uniref:hypothetical protein n=1 Tax=Paraglaciecola sp. MB-3u-78 TaxID=2058332 RepID=UPI000C31CEA3|nr:hypothetical protein [Paraglaciecola sp. MB-3u-78]PKG97218.1 hypothetical protein CXF95_19915 [Paraglaciecola sp. MB-3u-78]